jgi:predicted Holliday junction resolvase-like endonuclease
MAIELFKDSTFLLLIATNVSIVCLLLLARVRKLQKALVGLQSQLQQETGKLSRNQQALINRLGLVEKQLDGNQARVARSRSSSSRESSVSQASKLLDLGVDARQLAQGLGLSQAEARLMSLVHEQQNGEYKAA